MSRWVLKGLKTGVVSTRYPDAPENAPGITPGFPENAPLGEKELSVFKELCPFDAVTSKNGTATVDRRRCSHCMRCASPRDGSLPWDSSFEWAFRNEDSRSDALPAAFKRSAHIRIIDTGDCGACLNETKLLNNPYYNMHRLGFFITPTPRQADILLVVGPVADHMKTPLLKTYEAMPEPKKVLAVGACAYDAGVFADSFMIGTPLKELIPVDVFVPGCPPPPLAILHGLLLLAGRAKETGDETGKTYSTNSEESE